MITIVVVSDIKIYCEGLGHILAGTRSINVIDSVGSSTAAIRRIAESKPDVVLLDMTMAASCDLAQHISRLSGHTNIVALAIPNDENNIMRCAEAGITGYVLREASIHELIEAVMEAANGRCYCPQKIAACILKKVQDAAGSMRHKHLAPSRSAHPSVPVPSSLPTRLTRREQEISTLLSEGLSNKQIARDLSIEVSTVKNHVHNILVKLEASSRGQVVSLLQKDGHHQGTGSLDLDPIVKASL